MIAGKIFLGTGVMAAILNSGGKSPLSFISFMLGQKWGRQFLRTVVRIVSRGQEVGLILRYEFGDVININSSETGRRERGLGSEE